MIFCAVTRPDADARFIDLQAGEIARPEQKAHRLIRVADCLLT
jgi:hypothetical protein